MTLRLALAVAMVAVSATVFLLGSGPASSAVVAEDRELAALIRFMVVMKSGIVIGAALLVERRLCHPIGTALASAFIAAIAVAAAGPALMWHLTALGIGAYLYYGGLGAVALLAWWDRAVVRALLAMAVALRSRGVA